MLARSIPAIGSFALASVAVAQPPLFPTPVTATGKLPTALDAADLDGDGLTDVVFASYGLNDITLATSDGDGRFSIGTSAPCDPGPGDVVLCDLDADGDADVVTATNAGTLSILHGDGAGGFAPFQSIGVGMPLAGLEVVDVDLDGDLDPVVSASSSATGAIRCLKNGGSGGFSVLIAPTFFGVWGIACADATGDAVPDVLAVTRTIPKYAVVMRGLGDGSFQFHESELVGFQPEPTDCALADFDFDGDRDVAASDGAYLRNDGAGHLSSLISLHPPVSAARCAATDLTGDGVLDLVGFGEASATLAEGSGDPTLTQPFAVTRSLSARGASGAVFDCDSDGRQDVVSAAADSGGLAVALQDAFGRFGGSPIQSSYTYEQRASYLDLDHDGDLDVAALSSENVLRIERNDGFGNLAPAPPAPLPSGGSLCNGVFAADLSGDGNPDLLCTPWTAGYDLQVALLGASGDVAQWVASPTPAVGSTDHVDTVLGDVDQDGALDVAFARRQAPQAFTIGILPGNGDGSFAPQAYQVATGTLGVAGVGSFRMADVDQSGTLDLLIGDSATMSQVAGGRLSRRLGTGAFVFGSLQAASTPFGGPPCSLVTLDIDSDGLDDVAAIQDQALPSYPDVANRLTLFTATGGGSGSFAFQSSTLVAPFSSYHTLAATELGPSQPGGPSDLAYGSHYHAQVVAFEGDGAGAFTEIGRYGVAHGPIEIAAVDLDQDGRPDLTGSPPFALLRSSVAPPCAGAATQYGGGCAGATSFTPHLAVDGCIAPGGTMSFALTGAPGSGVAVFLLGTAQANLPAAYGCSLLVFPVTLAFPLPLSAINYWNSTDPGAGTVGFVANVPAWVAPGSSVFVQAFTPVAGGYGASNGVQLSF